MSKPFTNSSLTVLIAALLLIQGCATVEVDEQAQPAEPSVTASTPHQKGQADQIDQIDRRLESMPAWQPETMAVVPDVLVPKVHRGNAAAFEQAVAALRAGRLNEAEVLLQEITSDQPELAGPWVNLGQVYAMLEKFEEARLAFGYAIAANPRTCAAHNQLGVLSRQFGDFQAAEEHYRQCLAQVPNFKDAYLNLGILYELYLGRLPEALEAYRRYQLLATEPNRKVQGWVMDLERRLGV
jgi:tetratricopeptide (TPR) repeat protein